jgi:hypothetical protein
MNLSQQLIGPLVQVADSVIVVEFRRRYHAFSRAGNELHFRSNRHHDWSAVAGLHSPAPGARGSDPADLAILLHAKVDGLAPFVVLVVVIASRIQQKVSSDAAHVAQQRSGD